MTEAFSGRQVRVICAWVKVKITESTPHRDAIWNQKPIVGKSEEMIISRCNRATLTINMFDRMGGGDVG